LSGETETGIIEFEDKSIIDKVIGSLNGLSVASVPMRLSRATVIQLREAKEEIAQSKTKSHVSPLPSNPLPLPQTQTQTNVQTFSLILNNIFLAQELAGSESDAQEVIEDIRSDVEGECSKYGRVLSVTISMPSPSQISQTASASILQQGEIDSSSVPVLVTFATEEERQSASASLKGRKFDGRTIIVEFGK
jgi:splicing factor U2AF subunit